ncbi:MAG: hypothetical protein ABIG95_00495 [Candidatus Woesearchaeota archaeon]
MNPLIHEDVLNVFQDALDIIQKGEFFKLKELSNHTIHNASIFQDEDSVSVAVIIYALSKILERGKLATDTLIRLITESITSLKAADTTLFREKRGQILSFISEADSRLKIFIEEVIRQAQIKKGTKLYDHGVSLGQAADILGISQWELMNYVGKTHILDAEPSRPDAIDRIHFARGLFQ